MNNTDKKFPKVVTGVLVYNKNNEIFLAQSSGKLGDKWSVPGGHLEWGETLIDSVKRELKEETNINVKNIKLIGTQESIFSGDFIREKHFIFFDFSAEVLDDQVVILNDEFHTYLWIQPDRALIELDIGIGVTTLIKRFLKID